MKTQKKENTFKKRFKILLDLEGGDLYGNSFECLAENKNTALKHLSEIVPGAVQYVKMIKLLEN